MSETHEVHAKQNPRPYDGKVTRHGTPQADKKKCSVIEAANYYDLPPLLSRFGDWVICENGIHCLYIEYYIAKSRLDESDWVDHVTEKPWVNARDFISAFEEAKNILKI